MPSRTEPRRVAYSYIRISSAQQASGGGPERQTELTRKWCERRGVPLNPATLEDLGVSAFRGSNVREGALAGFLEACRMGRVPAGSFLVVESLDRLSRDQIRPALQLFLQLQEYGVTIVTHQPEREYPPDASDALALIEPLIVFSRAHEESAMKSHRRRDGWKRARESARAGKPMMKTCPAWMEATASGFKLKPDAAEAVRRIYRLCLDGFGVHRITETLVRENVAPFAAKQRWVKAYVYKILANPAAMGSYQPNKQVGKKLVPDGEPIPGYYPAVVSEEEWLRVQNALQAKSGGRGAGRISQEANLFSKLVRCAVTKERMNLIHALGRKTEDGERKRYVYLASTRETGAPLRAHSIDYSSVEDAFLHFLCELKPADVMPAEQGKRGETRAAKLAALSGRLLDLDNRIARTKERASKADDYEAFLDIVAELQKERRATVEAIAQLSQEETGSPAADLGEAQSLVGLLKNCPEEQREELRRRLKARIRALVKEIWVWANPNGRSRGKAPRFAHVQVFLRAGGVRTFTVYHPKPFPGVKPLAEGIDLRTYRVPGAKAGAQRTPVKRSACSAAAKQADPSA